MNEEPRNRISAGEKFPTIKHLASSRFLRFIGVALLAIITLIALFYAIENWRGARDWKRVEARLQDKEIALSFAEFVRPLPPDDENFASIPFFQPLFDRTVDAESGKERWQIHREENPIPTWPSELTSRKGWKRGERHEFVWKRDDDDPAEFDGVNIVTNTPVEAVRLLLTKSSVVMSQIEVGLERPKSQFPIRYEDGVGALLPHLQYYKHFAQLFAARVFVHLHDENATAALSDIRASLRLADTIKMESTLISGLVRNAIVDITLYPVWQGLVDHVWSETQLASLQKQLERTDLLQTYRQGMLSELIFGIEFCDTLEQERSFAMAEVMGESGDDGWATYLRLAPRGWLRKNKATMAGIHERYSLRAFDMDTRVFDTELMEEWRLAVEGDAMRGVRMAVVVMMMPALGKAAERFAEAQTMVDLAAVATALERYRFKYGVYPDEPSALVPEFVTALPRDIIDGDHLRYRKTGDAFVLYSIGLNQSDDGGALGEGERERRNWQADDGDWVWAYSPEDLALD
jgi:hypothetical protein